jgi:hypothetical protein
VLLRALGSALKGRFTRLPPVARPVLAATGSNEPRVKLGFTAVKGFVLLAGAIPALVASPAWKP